MVFTGEMEVAPCIAPVASGLIERESGAGDLQASAPDSHAGIDDKWLSALHFLLRFGRFDIRFRVCAIVRCAMRLRSERRDSVTFVTRKVLLTA